MLRLAQVLIAGVGSGLVAFGGWAVVTVKALPEYFVAGRAYTLDFQVRQHGRTLLTGLQPALLLSTAGRADTTIPAAGLGDGAYRVTFTAPAADHLSLTINSGFRGNELRLDPAPVVAAGASRAPLPAAERGRQLFVAKGCVTCHETMAVGPRLPGPPLPRAAVVQKITHPESQIMPDLGLSDAEAGAIAAFVSGGASATGAAGNR